MSRGDTRRALGALWGGVRQLLAVRWVRVLAVLGVLAVAGRLALGQALRIAVDRVVAARGLRCTWRDLDLSVLGGRARLSDLQLRPRVDGEEGAAPPPALFEMEYALLDLDVSRLLLGRLSVSRAEVDGLDLRVERDADGGWNLEPYLRLEELRALLAGEGTEPTPAAEAAEPKPLDLTPPLALQALRLQSARLRLVDRTFDPPTHLVFQLNADLSHLRDPRRPTRFAATLTGGEVLDAAHLSGELRWSADELGLWLTVNAGSLRPRRLAPYLERLDVRPGSGSLTVDLEAEVTLAVGGEERRDLSAHATIRGARVTADGKEVLALDTLELAADSLLGERADVPRISLSGVRGRAGLRPDGALRVAGVDLLPKGGGSLRQRRRSSLSRLADILTPSELPRWATLLLRADPEAPRWALGELTLREGRFAVLDESVDPPADLSVVLDEVLVRNVQHDPTVQGASIPILAQLSLPGVVESLRLEGELSPFAPDRAVDLRLVLEGVGLAGLEGYLEQFGLERAMEAGTAGLHLLGAAHTDAAGRTTGQLAVEELSVREETELLGLRRFVAEELLLDPTVPLLRVGNLAVEGSHLTLGRDPSSQLFALGLRTLGLVDRSAPAAPVLERGETPGAPAVADAPPAPERHLRVEVARLAWTDSDVVFVDEVVQPPLRLALDEVGLEVLDLTLGGDPDGPEAPPAQVAVRLAGADVVDELALEGTLRSRPGTIDLSFDLELRGEGPRDRVLAAYLGPLGIEPHVEGAAARGRLTGTLADRDGTWHVDATLADGALTLDGETLASVEEARLSEVVAGETLSVGSIEVTRPFLRLTREAGGGLVGLGLRRPPEILDHEADGAGGPAAPAAPAPLALPSFPDLTVGQVAVRDARVSWTDATFTPALETELALEASLLDLRTDGVPVPFEARLAVPALLEALALEGELWLGPEELGLAARVEGSGLRAAAVAPLLPEGVAADFDDGRWALRVEARAAAAPEGGLALALDARDLSWGDGAAEPWLTFAEARLEVPRVDPVAGVLDLGAAAVRGLELGAARDEDGTLRALGLALSPAAAASPAAPAEGTAPDEAARTPAPAAPALPFTRVRLTEALELGIERFLVRDATLGPTARPLEGSVVLRVQPADLLGQSPQELPPWDWSLSGALAGLVERWEVVGRLAPFAPEPSLEAQLSADGVRTAGLVELVPALAPQVTGTVEQGRVEGRLEGRLFVRRARPTELGIERPFGAELLLEGLAFRDAPGGTVLAGLERLEAEVKRVDLERGRVHVGSLDLTRPQGVVVRRGERLSALGLVVDLAAAAPPAAAGDPAPPPTGRPIEAAQRGADGMAAAVPAAGGSEGELRLDSLTVSGLDFVLRDETPDPPLVVPLSDLDVELRRFTTRALEERRVMPFGALLVAGSPDGEAAPLFEEAALAGRLALYPAPEGWARLSLLGLELAPLSGLAEPYDVVLENGALDVELELRQQGSTTQVSTDLVFTDLDVEEPEGGVIAKTLGLPMPLGTALFILRNPDGTHRFSVGFAADGAQVGTGQLAMAGTKALGGVLTQTLAGAPVRLLTAVLPTGEVAEREPWSVSFAPAASDLDPAEAAALVEDVRRALGSSNGRAVLAHRLSAADVARADRLANPSTEECLEMIAGLRQRKADLAVRRDALAARTRALLALGSEEAAGAGGELRALERRLASVEDALDDVLEVLRSDSERRRARRTRAVCLEIARRRLAVTEAALHAGLRNDGLLEMEVRPLRFQVSDEPGPGGVSVQLR